MAHWCPLSLLHLQGSTWTLIDLPGHDSLRSQYLEKFKSSARWESKKSACLVKITSHRVILIVARCSSLALLPFRAIVFVVDGAIFQKEVRDVAEFLYVLLTDAVISRNAPALLVACNKQGAVTPRLSTLNPVFHF